MPRYFLIFIVVLIGCASYSQKNNEVLSIEFTSLTRGYSSQVIFTKDSLFSTVIERGGEPKIRKEKIKQRDWENLLESVREVKLVEVPDLKSPTMKRAFDGAKHSTLSFKSQSGTVYTHTFDDEEPHEKLLPLMKVISLLKKQ